MQAKKVAIFALGLLVGAGLLFAGASIARADDPPPTPVARPVPIPITNPPVIIPRPTFTPAPVAPVAVVKAPELLVWDAPEKEQTVKTGATTAEFFFACTNVSDTAVVVTSIQTSCGCTVAKAPPMPWTIAPHTDGKIDVSVNLLGKSGMVIKQVTVNSTNSPKVLNVKINIPENPEMARISNQRMATVDPQAIFKGDCARCHVQPIAGKADKELYKAACGICHESDHRATMVPDLHNLNHPTDYAFWKAIMTNGKPGTLMPPFSVAKNGPLTDAQIDSLAQLLTKAFPTKIFSPTTNAPVPVPLPTPIIPARAVAPPPPPAAIK